MKLHIIIPVERILLLLMIIAVFFTAICMVGVAIGFFFVLHDIVFEMNTYLVGVFCSFCLNIIMLAIVLIHEKLKK